MSKSKLIPFNYIKDKKVHKSDVYNKDSHLLLVTINNQVVGVWMPLESISGVNFIDVKAFKSFVKKLKIEVQKLPRTKRMK